MKIVNISKDTILADKAELADTFFKRLIGLLNRKSLDKGEALILSPSNCIHSFFMRFSIDVLFLDQSGKVTATLSSFRSFRVSPIYFNSSLTIELPETTLKLTNTQPGDTIQITP
jgi:hypothetical protein